VDEVLRLRLECVEGNARGTAIPVDSELMIGRHAAKPGNLADDDRLSRQHVRIHRAADATYVIDDLVSTNGTFVNGVRIAGTHLLADGDRIEVGGTTLVARLQHSAPDRPSLEATGAPSATASRDAVGSRSARLMRFEVDFEAREVTVQLEHGPLLRLLETPDGWRQG
jgi:pSer/pThr/pTyr-binding forkhead associated (FHA) protein